MVKKSTHLLSLASILVSQDPMLNVIVSQANIIQKLHQCLHEFLEHKLIQHVSVGSYSNNSLTLIAHSSAAATRLRMHVPKLLKLFQTNQSVPDVTSIRIRVIPNTRETYSNNRTCTSSAVISNETAQLVKKLAKTIDDKEISECLQRISTRFMP